MGATSPKAAMPTTKLTPINAHLKSTEPLGSAPRGRSGFSFSLRTLPSPQPNPLNLAPLFNKSLAELCSILRANLSSALPAMMALLRFLHRNRWGSVFVSRFAVALRSLSSNCPFRDKLH